jgi:KDO2-lipid IV(A) lauroyltransferase
MMLIPYLFRCLSWLPLPALHALGSLVGRIAYWVSPGLRRRVRANLPTTLPNRATVLRENIRQAGMQVLELAWVWTRPTHDILAKVSTDNPEVLSQILAQDRPVLILTPHIGCFELVAQGYMASQAGQARPMLALYREPRKAALRPLFVQARARSGLRLAPADLKGVRLMLRAMQNREVIGLLPDQVPSQGDGVWVPFFGRPAFTMTLHARLAHTYRANVVFVSALRKPHGQGFTMHWEPFTSTLTGEPTHDATLLNAALEQVILRCPEQYLWSYNRYKAPAGSQPQTEFTS